MGDSIVVQVAVGLALIFLVLATLASALTELMSKVFRVRAKTLWKSLAGLLNPPAVKTYGPPEGTSTDFGLAAASRWSQTTLGRLVLRVGIIQSLPIWR